MRTIIEIPDFQLEQLARFAAESNISRAELIRRAVAWRMGLVKALFDTNILIGYLNGIEAAKEEIKRYPYIAISVIT